MENPSRAPRDGSVIVENGIKGYVCTARRSFSLNESVGLALVDADLAEEGKPLEIYEDECEGQLLHATVTPTPFYDPEGNRLRM
jgi:sarcosine oxidase subunit alpha